MEFIINNGICNKASGKSFYGVVTFSKLPNIVIHKFAENILIHSQLKFFLNPVRLEHFSGYGWIQSNNLMTESGSLWAIK